MTPTRWAIVIPARLSSTRLERKPLQDLCGKPLVVRVYENLASLIAKGVRACVATDSEEVAAACASFSVPVEMTSTAHPSGSDRVFEISKRVEFEKFDYLLNVQGDEPFADIHDLTNLMRFTESHPHFSICTLAFVNRSAQDFNNPNVVKIAISTAQNRALYFSRSPIPFFRDQNLSPPSSAFYHHQGVYAFSRTGLEKFCTAEKPSPLEAAECLEQLRALECGLSVGVSIAKHMSRGVDTLVDLNIARELFSKTSNQS